MTGTAPLQGVRVVDPSRLLQAGKQDIAITKVAQRFARDSMPGYPVRMPGVCAGTPAPALGADNARLALNPAAAWEIRN